MISGSFVCMVLMMAESLEEHAISSLNQIFQLKIVMVVLSWFVVLLAGVGDLVVVVRLRVVRVAIALFAVVFGAVSELRAILSACNWDKRELLLVFVVATLIVVVVCGGLVMSYVVAR